MSPRRLYPIALGGLGFASLALVRPVSGASDAAAADPIPGFGVLIAVIAILAAIGIARHKRRTYESESG